jgi:hypothetical protein
MSLSQLLSGKWGGQCVLIHTCMCDLHQHLSFSQSFSGKWGSHWYFVTPVGVTYTSICQSVSHSVVCGTVSGIYIKPVDLIYTRICHSVVSGAVGGFFITPVSVIYTSICH